MENKLKLNILPTYFGQARLSSGDKIKIQRSNYLILKLKTTDMHHMTYTVKLCINIMPKSVKDVLVFPFSIVFYLKSWMI
jgi:hypothetical protein